MADAAAPLIEALEARHLLSAWPIGLESQVNTYTTNSQFNSSVAMDSAGNYVVVWQSAGSAGTDSSGYSIQGQRYNAAGVAQGSQFQVNSYTTGNQFIPWVAMDSAGDFVVVWYSLGSAGGDTSGESIQGQRYNAAGAAQGAQFQVNTYTTNGQLVPSVAMDLAGDFVVVWISVGSASTDNDGYSIQGQRYNAAGVAQGAQFQVNTYTTNGQLDPIVAMDSAGDSVVVWNSFGSAGTDTSGYSVQGQRYNAAGVAQGAQFQVNSYTTNVQYVPSVAMDTGGDFVVIWDSNGSAGTDTNGYSIQGQRYNAAGVAQGTQFQVNSYTTSDQFGRSVAADSAGDFVVIWYSLGSAGTDTSGYSIQGQRYNAAGVAQGTQFQINSYTTNRQYLPSVAMDSAGDFVVVWESSGSADTDSSFYSIQARRYINTPEVNAYTTNQQSDVSVATDSAGDYVVVWSSGGSAGADASGYSVQGQRYNVAGVAQGAQFQVNSYTTSNQFNPSVAMDSAGDFVVVWESFGSAATDTSGYSIQGQRYNAAGVAQGAQFQVNSYTTNKQAYASVAMDSAGNFVVAWSSIGGAGTDTTGYSIQALRYNAAGVAQGTQFQVNSYTTNNQFVPSVAMDLAGDFVVVWESYGSAGTDTSNESIQGRRYNAAGVAQGTQFQVNSYTTSSQSLADVAVDAAGNFVVVWESFGTTGTDASGLSVQGQRYNAAGVAQGTQFQVNSYTTNNQAFPSVAMDAAGDFVVVWASTGSAGSDNDLYSIQGQRYTAAGVAFGQFQVNTYTTGYQGNLVVAMDAAGDFVIAWDSPQDGSSTGIYSRRYPALVPYQVNSYTSADQRNPAVAMDASGGYVVVWESYGSFGPDNDGSSIQGQRYNTAGTPTGPQFQVNTYTTSLQLAPGIAMDSSGNFTVVWESLGSSTTDTSGFSIHARQFNASGLPSGGEFQVNSYTTNTQFNPSIAMDPAGDFVIAWDSGGAASDSSGFSIQAQRYSSGGATAGGQFQVNTYTTGNQQKPSVAVDAAGNFLVVWQSQNASVDTSGYSIQAQRFTSAGATVGTQFQVNTYTTGDQLAPAAARDSSGNSVILWQSATEDNGTAGIYAQRFNSGGALVGTAFRVNSYTTGSQTAPAVAMNATGGFVATWQSDASGSDSSGSSVQAQRYTAAGAALGPQIQVNLYTTGNQTDPAVAMNATGDFVVDWQSVGNFGSDSSSASISAREYKTYVRVNDNWHITNDMDGSNSLSFGDLVDNATDLGDLLVSGIFGVDAFATIAGGFAAVAPGGTVDIQRGTQSESQANILRAGVNVLIGANVSFAASQTLDSLSIASSAAVNFPANGSRVLVTKSLSVSGKLDLFDNAAIVDWTGSSPLAALRTALVAGYGPSRNWAGTSGITSSLGNATSHTLGVAEATDVYTSFPASFAGQSVDNSAVLIRYTLYGDFNLSGTTDFADLGILLNHFNSPQGYAGGDADYSGTTNFADLGLLLNNYNLTLAAPSVAAASELVSAVLSPQAVTDPLAPAKPALSIKQPVFAATAKIRAAKHDRHRSALITR